MPDDETPAPVPKGLDAPRNGDPERPYGAPRRRMRQALILAGLVVPGLIALALEAVDLVR